MVELLLGLGVVVALIVVILKLLKAGFRREDARVAATLAAVDRIVSEWDADADESIVVMDANLLLNARLPKQADQSLLDLAHKEYERLFIEERTHLEHQAHQWVSVRDRLRKTEGRNI